MTRLTEAAFGELYRRHARPLWTYAVRMTGNAGDADDITQDAFVRLLQSEVGDRPEEELRRYLFRIASHLLVDRWRRSARERSWRERIRPAHSPMAPAQQAEEVLEIFAKLTPRERALLWLAYVEQEDHQSIADALRVKRASVKVLLSRARTRLRDLMKSTGAHART